MFRLFSKGRSGVTRTAEEAFWAWFVDNKDRIETLLESPSPDYAVYHQLTSRIKSYHPSLFTEITKGKDNRYVLVITPDGLAEGVEPTQRLAKHQPPLDNWVVKKFRQPNDEITMNFDGLTYPSDDIVIVPEIDRERELVDIEVFIRNMNQDVKRHQHLAFLYFDHILGEFNTITKVGYIGFHHLDADQTVQDGVSLLELRRMIEQELY